MRVTIIPDDNVVVVDGRGLSVDLSHIAVLRGIHAIVWDGSKGFIEHQNVGVTPWTFKLNEDLRDFSIYQPAIDAWRAAATEEDAKIKALAAGRAAARIAALDPTTTAEYQAHVAELEEWRKKHQAVDQNNPPANSPTPKVHTSG